MLPGFDGLEVCRRIQATRPVPVLMLTARDDEADVLVGLASAPTTTSPSRSGCASWWPGWPRCCAASTAPPSSPHGRAARLVVGDLRRRHRARGGDRRRRGGAPHADRVRPAGPPGRHAGQVLTREQLLAEVWDWPDASGHPHGRQPRQGAARQDRRRPGAHRPRRRLRPGGPASGTQSPAARAARPRSRSSSALLVAASVLVAALVGTLAAVPAYRCCSPSR